MVHKEALALAAIPKQMIRPIRQQLSSQVQTKVEQPRVAALRNAAKVQQARSRRSKGIQERKMLRTRVQLPMQMLAMGRKGRCRLHNRKLTRRTLRRLDRCKSCHPHSDRLRSSRHLTCPKMMVARSHLTAKTMQNKTDRKIKQPAGAKTKLSMAISQSHLL